MTNEAFRRSRLAVAMITRNTERATRVLTSVGITPEFSKNFRRLEAGQSPRHNRRGTCRRFRHIPLKDVRRPANQLPTNFIPRSIEELLDQ